MKTKTDNNEPCPQVFAAFPSKPPELYDTVRRAIGKADSSDSQLSFHAWPESDIAGRPLSQPIVSGIENAAFVVADVTILNFNVTYEIGFAIGTKRRVYLIRNQTLRQDDDSISRVGIFDTLGHVGYGDSLELARILTSGIDQTPLETNFPLDQKTPVYILETPYRNDDMGYIVSRTKKARLQYRSFNPSEEVRMAAIDSVKHVASSHGVILPLLSTAMRDASIHNIRAAFVAGLAHGMRKPTLILQGQEGPVPLDVRDFVKSYRHLNEIDEYIQQFALEVVDSMQNVEPAATPTRDTLARLTIGDPMAENEFQILDNYYLRRDEFGRSIRGEVNMVVGRKGSGKTALFSQVRNELRRDTSRIVVDLKPEGYQLVKLKEFVLDHLTGGAKEHLITAFWEYLLLLEVAYKLLEKDQTRYMRDHDIHPHYKKLQDTYQKSPNVILGDFSERLRELSSHVSDEYYAKAQKYNDGRLTSDEITEVLHSRNIKELRGNISRYLEYKAGVWILFDNLDRGWNVPRPTTSDILILRCLMDAGRKIQREMQREGHDFHCVVFIRNDVYQLLMNQSPDFGKEMRVSLDWSDAEVLREVIRLRLVYNGFPSETKFSVVWPKICISHYRGEETSQYMIDRCLMRPRNLLKILNHCKGSAVNLGHDRIEADDIKKGILSYSYDLLIEASQELANIDPQAEDVIYRFIGESWSFSEGEMLELLKQHDLREDQCDSVLTFLLYFGFLGIRVDNDDPLYIFHVGYDMKQLQMRIEKNKHHLNYTLNPAFWPALGVGP